MKSKHDKVMYDIQSKPATLYLNRIYSDTVNFIRMLNTDVSKYVVPAECIDDVNKRLANPHGFQILKPVADLLVARGFMSRATLEKVFEDSHSKKVMADAVAKVQELSSQASVFNPEPDILSVAVLRTWSKFFEGKQISAIYLDVLLSFINWKASSGLPDLVKKKFIYRKIRQFLIALIQGRLTAPFAFGLPTLLFTRAQVKKKELKRRMVFGYPAFVTATEAYFFARVFPIFKDKDTPYVTGYTQEEVGNLISKHRDKFCYCGDFSKFDLRLPLHLSAISFRLIKMCLKHSLSPFESDLYQHMVKYFLKSEAYHSLSGYITRKRGVPSGSMFTNMVDSISCYIIVMYGMLEQGVDNPTIYVHGDDFVVFTDVKVNSTLFGRSAARFGMKLNESDEYRSNPGVDTAMFLGSLWTRGMPTRDKENMALQASLFNGKLPPMSEFELVISRIVSVFGYDCRLEEFVTELRLPTTFTRHYQFTDSGGSVLTGSRPEMREGKWVTEQSNSLKDIWRTR